MDLKPHQPDPSRKPPLSAERRVSARLAVRRRLERAAEASWARPAPRVPQDRHLIAKYEPGRGSKVTLRKFRTSSHRWNYETLAGGNRQVTMKDPRSALAEFLVAALLEFVTEFSDLQRSFCQEHPEFGDIRDGAEERGRTDFEFSFFWEELRKIAAYWPTQMGKSGSRGWWGNTPPFLDSEVYGQKIPWCRVGRALRRKALFRFEYLTRPGHGGWRRRSGN